MRPGSPVGASEAAGPALCPGQYLPACGNGSRTGGIHFADLRRWPKSGSPAFDRSAHRFPSGAAPPFPKTDALSASAANRAGIPAAYRKPFPVRHAEQPEKLFKALGFSLFRTGDPLRHRHQLSQPVSEALRGVDYVNEWLRRLCLEQAFLDCFDPVLIRAVLEQSCPDYRNLLINLYEPVAVNALGLAILGDDPRTLSNPASRWQKLENRLTGLSRKTLADTLSAGAATLCSALELPPALLLHTQTTAQNLLPRLRAALQGGTTAHLFLSL